MIDKEKIFYFALGEFVATTMLEGIINPDMQLCNIGVRNSEQFAFLDFPNLSKVTIHDDLDDNNIRRLTESLFPILDDLKSFSSISYFRAGFVSKGGYFGRSIFSNACNNGFSSLSFLSDGNVEVSFAIPTLQNSALIKEWIQIETDNVNIRKYETLEKYQNSSERKSVSPFNCYYLDCLYFVRSFLGLQNIGELMRDNIACLLLNMANSALYFNLPATAYGLYHKCISLHPQIHEIDTLCRDGIKKSKIARGCIADFIADCLHLDFIEFLWVLDDLDRIVPSNANLHYKSAL